MENYCTLSACNNNSSIPPCKRTTSKCLVCGDRNGHSCFGSIACAACKMFFRRHINLDTTVVKCIHNGACDINAYGRQTCQICRLEKCFAAGMQRELTRPCRVTKTTVSRKQKAQPLLNRSLNLLNDDHSRLTRNQWCLLSNIIHAYDETSPLSAMFQFINSSSIYPPKKRLTMSQDDLKELLGLIYRSSYTFLEKVPDFTTLPAHDQKVLVERNVHNLGSASGLLILRDGDFYGNYAFNRANVDAYGQASVDGVSKLINRLDVDGTLTKLILLVFAFSTSIDVVYPPTTTTNSWLSRSSKRLFFISSIHIFKIQNKYIELMFTYMIYRYGYRDAVIRFSNLLFNILHLCVFTAAAAVNSHEHDVLVTDAIEDITNKLAVE